MSSLSPDYAVPDNVVAAIRPMWEAALDDSVPWVGKPIEARVWSSTRWNERIGTVEPETCPAPRVLELFGAFRDAFGAVEDVAEPRAVVLHGYDYAEVRKFGRQFLDDGDVREYPLGVQARLWGARVITNAARVWKERYGRPVWVPKGLLRVVGETGDGWVRQEIQLLRGA